MRLLRVPQSRPVQHQASGAEYLNTPKQREPWARFQTTVILVKAAN